MKKKRKIITVCIFVVLSVFLIMAGLFASDSLPQKLTYKINGFITSLGFQPNGKGIASGADNFVVYVPVEKKMMPDDLKAVWLDEAYDITADPAYGLQAFLSEADLYFNYFDNFLTNALFIKPDTLNKFSGLTDANGNAADILREYMNRAAAKEYTKGLIVDESMLYTDDGKLSFDTVKFYLTNYSFDAVVLDSEALSKNGRLNSAAPFVRDAVKAFDSELFFGVVVIPDAVSKYADAQTVQLLTAGISDFIIVRADGSLHSASLPFAAVMSWWNEYAQYFPATRFYIMHRTDLVCQGASEWSDHAEIAEEMRYMWDFNNVYGSVFYSASSLRANKSSFAQRIAFLLDDGESKTLKVKKIDLNAQNNTVLFSGVSDFGHRLLCNHTVAKENGGAFSLTYPLSAGDNVFSFSSCGREITYRIFNNSHLIHSYYPQTDINASKDDVVTIMAVCMSNCSVVCSLNGNDYPMTMQEGAAVEGMPQGFSVFTCAVNFTGSSFKDINLGNITITAVLEDVKEAVTCGRVTLLKSNSSAAWSKVLETVYKLFYRESPNNSEYTEISSHSDGFKVSPYKDNGLGTSLMCKIYYDDTEQLGRAGAYDTYQADLSALCKGTLDYVDNMTVSEEGYIRYELRSGISVYGVNCELINNAFTMPQNGIIARGVAESVSSTDIVFETDWLVPVTVKTLPQSYSTGYLNYSYNVSNYTAEYVDVTFHHTSAFYNQESIAFAADSPFVSYELFTGNKGEMILRLHLRQKGQFYGFDIFTDENSNLVISFKKHTNGALYGKVIMVDPGHGGLAMTGTALRNETVAEAQVTLSIAKKVQQMLTEQGATVIMTRTMDTPLDLDERCVIMSEYNPDIFISIHCDGSDNESDSGTHTFYFRPYSQPLAKAINASLVSTYQNYIYQPGDTNYPSINRGIKFYPFFVTRLNQCPSELIETGFMTNIVEGSILANDNQQYWIAQGITYGLMNYFAANNSTVVS